LCKGQEVISYVRAKAQCKWDRLVIIVKQCPPLPKPILIKLVSKQMLKVLGLNAWDVESMLQNVTSKWKNMKIYKK